VNYSAKIKYKLFSDAPEVEMVEVDETDHVMSVGEFLGACISTCFMDYDGFGRFIKEVNDKKYAILDLSFSIDNDDVIYKGESIGSIFYVCNNLSLYEVVWFNK
jgi:hypothetical protein